MRRRASSTFGQQRDNNGTSTGQQRDIHYGKSMAKRSVNPARRPRQAAPSTAAAQVASASQAPSPGGEGVMSLVERVQRPVLAATYWFDPPANQEAQPYPVTIRFSGRRAGSEKAPQPGDTFTHEHTIERVVPGSGPI